MLIIITRATIKKTILEYIVKETKKLKQYTKKKICQIQRKAIVKEWEKMGEDTRNRDSKQENGRYNS